jgi:hypothetical protein
MHLKDWKQINPSFGFPLLTSDDFSHPQNYTLFSKKKFANPNFTEVLQCSIAHNYITIMITLENATGINRGVQFKNGTPRFFISPLQHKNANKD